jgi:hypothetical protein
VPDFVQTAPYDGSARGIVRGMGRKWAATHDFLYLTWRTVRWLFKRPITWPGMVAGGWLWSRGVPFWLVLPLPLAPLIWRADKSQVWLFGSALRSRSLTRGANTLSNWWRIRRGWSTGTRAVGFAQSGKGGQVPWLRHWELTNSGIAAWVTCGTFGWSADDLATRAQTIAAGISRCRGVTVTQGDYPGVARLDFAFSDPLADVLSVAELAAAPRARLTCGLTERGDPAYLHNYLSTLVVGLPGSGKSNMLWTLILSALAAGEPFELWVLDPAGGVELWELSNGSPLVRDYAASPAEMKRLVKDLHTKMIERMNTMAGKERLHTPTKEAPRWYLVVDEAMRAWNQLKKTGGNGPNHQQMLVEILSLGRKAAITTIALTQIPFGHAIGEQVRLLFPQKVVFRSNDWLVTNTAFGSGSEALGAAASKISVRTPGVGYMIGDTDTRPVRFRTPFISDFMTTLIAKGMLPDGIPTTAGAGQSWHNNEHVLYRWDTPPEGVELDGKTYIGVLYVGISVDGLQRADQHLSNEAKAVLRSPGVTMTIVERFNVESHSAEVEAGKTVRQVALEVEAPMIGQLGPPLNIAHNGRRRRKAIEW